MKSSKIKLLEQILRVMAFVVLKRYKPIVIGITGSVGKTSVKESVYAALSGKFLVRKNEKNYNNEIGIPLTVLGVETGGSSLMKWSWIFLGWLRLVILPYKYPEILVIEMGVDRPNDMDYLLSFVRPDIGIVTNISSSHLEYFGTLDRIAKEKGKLIEALPKDGFAILNADDERVLTMSGRTKANVITYGFSQQSNIMASNVNYHYDNNVPMGLSFKLSHEGKSMPVRLNGILARHQINAALAGIAAGIALKINLVEISQGIQHFSSPTGRLNIIEGKNGSHIIDDTYNASPTSTIAALAVLGDLNTQGKKIAVLGDMLELGSETEEGHLNVGRKISEIKCDLFFAIGKRMKYAVEELRSSGFGESSIKHFEDPQTAGDEVAKIVENGDLILVKGSQGMRMEKVVEKLMAHPENAKELISRQSVEWKNKPFMNP